MPNPRRAKDELMRLAKERREREAEEQRRDVQRFADTGLKKAVAADAMERDDPWQFVKDVAQHGCESGIVGHLVYYNGTNEFYIQHTEEIWDILHEDKENTGAPTILGMLAGMRWADNVGGHEQLLNYLAWYGYETAAQRLLDAKENETPE